MPEPLRPPADAATRLAHISAFAGLSDEKLAALAREVEWLRVTGGERLFAEGDPGDCAYFVVHGRFRVVQADRDGAARLIGFRGPGEPVGEVAVLADVPRTATLQAVRDTEVVRVDRATFDRLLRHDPATMVPLVANVATRLADALRGRVPDPARPSTIAVLIDEGVEEGSRVVDSLLEHLARRVPVARLTIRGGREDLPLPQLIAAIDEQEARGALSVLEVDATKSAVAHRGLRQADWVVVVAAPSSRPVGGAVRNAIAELVAGGCTPTMALVLVQPSWRARPIDTAARAAGFDVHFHIRPGADADVARLARHLTGAGVGLVLGGGGARSMAHLGAYRALVQAGVPIDRVGGSSIGGVVAAQIAAGGDPDELVRRNRASWRTARVGQRLTVPVLSLLSPTVVERNLERMFGDSDLEDLWLPCFVTAVDLTACRLVIRDRGLVRQWALATASPPGIWPPVVGEDGALFVDGAVADNLPVNPMRRAGAHRVVAVSVSRQPPFAASADLARTPTPAAYLYDRVRDGPAATFPNLLQVLYRTALVTGLERHAESRDLSDVFVEPDVDEFGIGDYAHFDEIVPRGYDAMRRALDACAAQVSEWA